jgi:2-polyprenyl-3-methyl-5-hydroxy-6-metoxy-1,4-benzoquinol methylase
MIEDEHFVPINGLDLAPYIQAHDIGAIHHLIRYKWALKVLIDFHPHNILDIACGSGYGSYMFAHQFPGATIIGADYDTKAIELAQQSYSLPNLQYKVGDVIDWEDTIGVTIFDCIVSFDTIEHVPHREIMLENLVHHLHINGSLLLSTPSGSLVNNFHPEWQYHCIEYSAASLYDFLKRYFKTILRPDAMTLPHANIFDETHGTGADYLLWMNPVICKHPVIFSNPYYAATPERMKFYARLRHLLALWRTSGFVFMIKQVLDFLRRQQSKH